MKRANGDIRCEGRGIVGRVADVARVLILVRIHHVGNRWRPIVGIGGGTVVTALVRAGDRWRHCQDNYRIRRVCNILDTEEIVGRRYFGGLLSRSWPIRSVWEWVRTVPDVRGAEEIDRITRRSIYI